MPIYEYQCQQCQHQLEALQKISDEQLQDCPSCGAASLKKKVSAAAFRLKGGGWYETDFKTGDKKNIATSASSDKSSAASDKSSAAPKSESNASSSDSQSGTSSSSAAN